ncbi:hypothetical protein BH23ACT7_BH23ACT7_24970 [soil metagenome]
MSRILIAEDEPRIASFLEKGLRANGFTTSVAEDGVQAVIRARSGDFDLLILDIGLPGKDGFSVLRELRGAGFPLPIIVLTARDGVAGHGRRPGGRGGRLRDQAVPLRGAPRAGPRPPAG